MGKKVKLFAGVFAVAVVSLVFFAQETSVSKPTQDDSKTTNTDQKYGSKVDDQENVTVTVTPVLPVADSGVLQFTIVMDTHSIELDQNMIDSTVLIDDQGIRYSPFNWEGSVGGHHREGVLTFTKITTIPKSVELKISGIGGVDRSFVWQFN